MTNHSDPVDTVVLAFLDYLEGAGPRPALDHLTDRDRWRAEALMDSLKAGRGIDPHASRPSVEALLTGTRLAGLLPAANTMTSDVADPITIQDVLGRVDDRARADIDPGCAGGVTVVYSYLDLRARFFLIDADTPIINEETRAVIETIFDTDPDTSLVGVVAALSDDLLTRVLSVNDVGHTVTTPRGEPHTRWEPPQPLALATRHLLEQCAPEWDSFSFDHSLSDPLDITAIAAEIAGQIIEREAARSYRGDKARAYRSLAGCERAFADLVTKVSASGPKAVDLAVETDSIVQAAA